MKKKFKIELRIKNCKEKFIPNEDGGVIAIKEIEYNLSKKNYSSPLFIRDLIEIEEEFMKSFVETKILEIE